MQQDHYDVFIRGTEYETKFKSMAASEQLLDNLVALRQTLWEMRAHLCQLEGILEQSQGLKEETNCLRVELDSLVKRIDLQRMRAIQE